MSLSVSPGREPSAIPTTGRRRYPALDGLRGLAALAVVLHHCLIVDPLLAVPVARQAGPPLTGWREALTYSPVHLFWAGSEAVLVFFVLSGFVLTLPFTDGRGRDWRAYYPRRLARLYLPVWGAVAFSVVVALLVPRETGVGQSIAVNAHAIGLNPVGVARDLLLLGGTDTLNGPLWSLRWEVLFSLLLPAYLLLGVRLKRAWPLLVPATLLLVHAGFATGRPALAFLPTFLLGVLMAAHRDRLHALADRIPRAGWWVLGATAVLLLLSSWTPQGLPRAQTPALVGAVLVVFAFLGPGTPQRLATTRPAAYLGTVSFSLYLVHDPIVTSVALLTGATNPFVIVALAVPLSLAAAWAFHRWVERPAHRYARSLGERFATGQLRTRQLRPASPARR